MPFHIHIAIIEDQEVFRNFAMSQLGNPEYGLTLHFYNNAEEFLSSSAHPEYNLLYVDLRLKDMNGIDLIQKLSFEKPEWRCVVFSSFMSDDQIFQALESGAIGYLYKTEVSNLYEITKIFLSGGSVISPSIAVKVLKTFSKPVPIEWGMLSDREKQVLDELVTGKSAEQISVLFGVSIHTVRTQVRAIYRKLQVNSRLELLNKMKRF